MPPSAKRRKRGREGLQGSQLGIVGVGALVRRLGLSPRVPSVRLGADEVMSNRHASRDTSECSHCTSLRQRAETAEAAQAVLRERIRALELKWAQEAHEIDQDGDFCCAQTRRHDAGELHELLRQA